MLLEQAGFAWLDAKMVPTKRITVTAESMLVMVQNGGHSTRTEASRGQRSKLSKVEDECRSSGMQTCFLVQEFETT